MQSKYVEMEIAGISMNGVSPSGDIVEIIRTGDATFILFVDGMGHGTMARVAARFIISRLISHIKSGDTIRKVFYNEIAKREAHETNSRIHGYFTVIRISEDGMSTILSYGMPKSIFVNPKYCSVLDFRAIEYGKGIVYEASSYLDDGEGILIFCDGIKDAGIGTKYKHGWGENRIAEYINECLASNTKLNELPDSLLSMAKKVWGKKRGDDCTVAIARIRKSISLNIFTGCPIDKANDKVIVKKFMEHEGKHIVMGGSTAKLVARELNTELKVKADTTDLNIPISYEIDGIDLVTEGINTLNQIDNLISDGPIETSQESKDPIFDLLREIMTADKITILLGMAQNPANKNIIFRQKGIHPRSVIIPKITERLIDLGKTVVIDKF